MKEKGLTGLQVDLVWGLDQRSLQSAQTSVQSGNTRKMKICRDWPSDWFINKTEVGASHKHTWSSGTAQRLNNNDAKQRLWEGHERFQLLLASSICNHTLCSSSLHQHCWISGFCELLYSSDENKRLKAPTLLNLLFLRKHCLNNFALHYKLQCKYYGPVS